MLKDNIAGKVLDLKKLSEVKISVLLRKSGLGKRTLTAILQGKTRSPGVYTVAKIADILKCSIEELIGESVAVDQELQLSLARSCVVILIGSLTKKKAAITLGDSLDMLQEIYIHCLNNNLKTVDEEFANKLIFDATDGNINAQG